MYGGKKEAGAALIMVLMIVAVMSVVVINTINRNKLLVKEAQMLKESSEIRLRAKTVRNNLIYLFTTTNLWSSGANKVVKTQLNLPLNMNLYGDSFEYMDSVIQIQSQTGLLSLSPFNRDGIISLMRAKGVSELAISTIADSIEDWIDEDDFVRINGAEKFTYPGNSFPRNGDFQTLNELMMVKGMTSEIWQIISPFLTLNGTSVLNNRYIPTEIIGYSESALTQKSLIQSRDEGKNQSWYIQDTNVYPGERLSFSIEISSEESKHIESFTLAKTRGMKVPYVITDVIVGNYD